MPRYRISVRDKSFLPFPKALMGSSDILLPDNISEEDAKKEIKKETEKLLGNLIQVDVEEVPDQFVQAYSGA